MEAKLNKNLYKIELLLIKTIPILIASIYATNTMLSFVDIDFPLLSLLGGMSILPIIFLYITSYVFKFCEYHRLFLHYIVINDLISYFDYYTEGIYFTNRTLLLTHILLIFIILLLVVCLKFKKNE